ncbi:MAG: phosphohydrolase [Mixta calida]|uniref:Phosphohydrolase n=1 Tax=Mixta calida TaxID=665913 RepID=A0ABN5HAU7_9GAMM|nr:MULTISPECIES: phosphohydrolase [Mixta]AIX73288.1 hydrolase [Pantoea sp. PSNIH2]MBS6059585.1 phosphohydrolase [Pantoea sp.]POU47929.1 phosphohydrolase [Pantoea sp. PSNIH5]POU66236.1 phosphohydrolase [Pantoea sp. PSNIH4]POY67893.1 phosphohydrolase [Pantoea sp. PSNIH3]
MSLTLWQSRFENWLHTSWPQDDKAHDIAHFRRVWKTAQHIMQGTEADPLVVLTACYFHDVVNLPKNHPQRHLASSKAAVETRRILSEDFIDFPVELHNAVAHAIQAHSFSAGIKPETLEARIVQDADRLESLGAIGLARVFYTSGALGRALFDSDDPLGRDRQLDDASWTLDHFQKKLLRLPDTMQTAEGKRLAQHNVAFLVTYMAKLCAELQGDLVSLDESVLRDFTPVMDEY